MCQKRSLEHIYKRAAGLTREQTVTPYGPMWPLAVPSYSNRVELRLPMRLAGCGMSPPEIWPTAAAGPLCHGGLPMRGGHHQEAAARCEKISNGDPSLATVNSSFPEVVQRYASRYPRGDAGEMCR